MPGKTDGETMSLISPNKKTAPPVYAQTVQQQDRDLRNLNVIFTTCQIHAEKVLEKAQSDPRLKRDMVDVLKCYDEIKIRSLALIFVKTGVRPETLKQWIAEVPHFRTYWQDIGLGIAAYWEGRQRCAAHYGHNPSRKEILDGIYTDLEPRQTKTAKDRKSSAADDNPDFEHLLEKAKQKADQFEPPSPEEDTPAA
jgi:hypothetical protein